MDDEKRRKEEIKQSLAVDSWRVFRIVSEFVDGFERMISLGPSVSIFGSSRLPQDSHYYNMAREVARELSKKEFTIITGGGPGIMEGANRGAQEGNGHSCGVCVDLPTEKSANPFVDHEYNLSFRYFFVRKVMFIRYAQGCVFLPGGVGTLDELFEVLTLIQTFKVQPFPVYLMGGEYWQGLLSWLETRVLAMGCISPSDFELFRVTDNPAEVADGIERHYQRCRAIKNF